MSKDIEHLKTEKCSWYYCFVASL